MTDTFRHTFDGKRVREGTWCRKCCSANCPWCVSGTEKYPARRRARRQREHQARRALDVVHSEVADG